MNPASRSSSITWSSVVCANRTHLATENHELGHNYSYAPDDNITDTFDDDINNHSSFSAGATSFATNACNYTINLYNGSAQPELGNVFEEIALWDGTNVVYAALTEVDKVGYNGATFDYQMIVPEHTVTAGVTTYYFYVELT